jgi:predicted ribosomally synthesized peptide with nif11-like leader
MRGRERGLPEGRPGLRFREVEPITEEIEREKMSVEHAKAFFERMKSDADFQQQLVGAADDDARKAIAREAGYEFTETEIQSVVSESGELSEEELEAVSGGVNTNALTEAATVTMAATAAVAV